MHVETVTASSHTIRQGRSRRPPRGIATRRNSKRTRAAKLFRAARARVRQAKLLVKQGVSASLSTRHTTFNAAPSFRRIDISIA
jgi:hypothetical protein